jgi:hypothetical protein
VNDPIHKEDSDGKDHNRRRAVDDKAECLQDGSLLGKNYTLAPSKLVFKVMTSGPNHIPIKRLVKASSVDPDVPNAPIDAVINEMIKGPQRSHCCLI